MKPSTMRKTILQSATCAAVLLALVSAPAFARQDEAAALERMRTEIEELKKQVGLLTQQIEILRQASAGPPSVTDAGTEPKALPQGRTGGQRIFNPAISAVFQGIGTSSFNHNRDEDGLQLSEAEIGFQAAVDPYARVDLFLSFNTEGEAEVEEGYVTTSSLPGGLQLRGGKFKDSFGKWNALHDHQFFTVDTPDVLVSYFGDEGLVSEGLGLSWLLPGTGSVFVESTSEVVSTGNDVSFNGRRRDYLLLQRLSSVFSLTPNATLEIGATGVTGKAGPTELLLDSIDDAGLAGLVEPSEQLRSHVFGADFTYKWKPVQYNVYRSFTWQSEILGTKRRIEDLDPATMLLDKRTLRSFGGYSFAEYQFAKRWRAGLRWDALQLPDDDHARQRALSAVLRIQPSEFQEFRIQFKHTTRNAAAAGRFDDIADDTEWFVEWIPAIGAHPAHKY